MVNYPSEANFLKPLPAYPVQQARLVNRRSKMNKASPKPAGLRPMGLANLSDTDCGSNDPDLKQEMEKQFVDLLTEELKLQEAVAEEHDRHMNITFGEAKKGEAEKCITATETCEGTREQAEALLIKERKVATTWEHRAREMGWEGE